MTAAARTYGPKDVTAKLSRGFGLLAAPGVIRVLAGLVALVSTGSPR